MDPKPDYGRGDYRGSNKLTDMVTPSTRRLHVAQPALPGHLCCDDSRTHPTNKCARWH